MSSEPIPEPLKNQEVRAEEEARFPASARRGPELVQQAAPPIPADRGLPRVPRYEERKGAVQEKVEEVKQATARAQGTTAQALHDAKEQTAAAVSRAKERFTHVYRESRISAIDAFSQARSRLTYLVDEYPLQVIVGVAAVAFVAGALLRVGRSNRDA